jgi:hypothetical protein
MPRRSWSNDAEGSFAQGFEIQYRAMTLLLVLPLTPPRDPRGNVRKRGER